MTNWCRSSDLEISQIVQLSITLSETSAVMSLKATSSVYPNYRWGGFQSTKLRQLIRLASNLIIII